MSEIYTNLVDWPDLRERIRPLLFPENNRIIDRYRNGEIKENHRGLRFGFNLAG